MKTPLMAAQEAARNFRGPKSFCTCGHTGDGPGSQHVDTVAEGHGRCAVAGCDCAKFSWARSTPQFEKALVEARGTAWHKSIKGAK